MRYFVIRGFGKKRDSDGREIDFNRVDKELIAPALKRCEFDGGTTQQEESPGNIRADMFALILEADVVVCDITVHNANVFYELGIRHALRKKHTVLIKGTPSADTTPFDLSTDRYLSYPVDDPQQAVDALVRAIKAAQCSSRDTDSPIFLMLPKLPETDAGRITVVPLSFTEEVQRAEAAKAKGWLRLLAEDVKGLRFEREALRLIGIAQWKTAEDFDGACATWERVREGQEQDLEANLALANVYERLYRNTKNPTLLEKSSQALQRVLGRSDLRSADRSEAAALQGRNLKTLWRRGFETLESVENCRQQAINLRAKESYEAYRNAFRLDLNCFFPGIAAYQMGRILQSLSASPRFNNLFTGLHRTDEAKRYREDLDRDLPVLEHVVSVSIEREIERLGKEHIWARISQADLQFLTYPEDELQADPQIVIDAYRNALMDHEGFYWNAARGQLSLFAQLDIRQQVAQAVIKELEPPQQTVGKPLHLVVFTGHMVDAPNAEKPRFPASPATEQRARELIEAKLQEIRRDDEELLVLASAAPGADILALEACAALGIETRLCLPMAAKAVASSVFEHYDAWRDRLFSLVKSHEPGRMLVLQTEAEMPRWLRLKGEQTPWERGNRWMLHLAQCWGAQQVTLLALWDRDESDLSTAGTAQLVRLARKAGTFKTYFIDCAQLQSI